jgi:GNAT superfamily N-acetyltransferase
VIRPLRDADLPLALAIAQEGVGSGWAERDDLLPAPRRRVVVAETGGVIAGVATSGLRHAAGLLERGHPVARRTLAAAGIRTGQTILLLDLAAVTPAARGRGLYTALLADRLAWGARRGAAYAVAFGWTPPDGCHIAPAMARAGFAAHAAIPLFFHETSLLNGARCPACGNPCVCAAVLFTRLLGR